jgi:hypothetical protein
VSGALTSIRELNIMDNQHLINALIGGGFAILGWFARELWGAVKELRADLAAPHERTIRNLTWPLQ